MPFIDLCMPRLPRKSSARDNPTPMGATFAGASTAFMKFKPDSPTRRRTWKTEHTFFCDETGNSGGRFYHPEQPIYGEGGWVVSHQDVATVSTHIEQIEKRNGFAPKTKGTALKSNPRGRRHIAEVFEVLRQVALPFIYLVEKRYFVCAKAVETYFDPMYNCAIDPAETWNPDRRQERAEMLYAAPDAIIRAFSEAYRMQDGEGIRSVGEVWEEWLIDHGDVGIATELRVSLSEIARHMNGEFTTSPMHHVPPGMDSLNLPAIAQVFQLVEQNTPPCEMIHDQCASFEAIYRYVFDLSRDATPAELAMSDGRKQTFGFERLHSLAFGDSEKQPMLRAADYQVACCVDFARKSFSGQSVTLESVQLAYPGLGALMAWAISHQLPNDQSMPQLGQVMASEAFVGRVFGNLIRMMHPDHSKRS